MNERCHPLMRYQHSLTWNLDSRLVRWRPHTKFIIDMLVLTFIVISAYRVYGSTLSLYRKD
jgi:hypothetical protein